MLNHLVPATGTTSTRRSTHRPGFGRSVGLLAVVIAALVLGACGGSEQSIDADEPAPGVASAEAARDMDVVLIDVRTPEEFAGGHIADAQLLDIQSPDFATGVAELDPDRTYLVYCRSGNRSAAAAQQMTEAGLRVLDGGGLNDMVTAGWPTA
jgi:rhodanese-related sulfurtransferase